jgi:hypothetical protein
MRHSYSRCGDRLRITVAVTRCRSSEVVASLASSSAAPGAAAGHAGHDGVDCPMETVVDGFQYRLGTRFEGTGQRGCGDKTNLWVSGMYWRRQVEKGLFYTIWWTNANRSLRSLSHHDTTRCTSCVHWAQAPHADAFICTLENVRDAESAQTAESQIISCGWLGIPTGRRDASDLTGERDSHPSGQRWEQRRACMRALRPNHPSRVYSSSSETNKELARPALPAARSRPGASRCDRYSGSSARSRCRPQHHRTGLRDHSVQRTVSVGWAGIANSCLIFERALYFGPRLGCKGASVHDGHRRLLGLRLEIVACMMSERLLASTACV